MIDTDFYCFRETGSTFQQTRVPGERTRPVNIAVFTSSRADFGLIRPILRHLVTQRVHGVDLVCLGRACALDDEVLQAGIGSFPILRVGADAGRENLVDSYELVQALARLTTGVSDVLVARREAPDWCLLPGDRFEMFAAATAAYYQNQPIAHLFAGDRSVGGHVDDNVRHAISKLAHAHLAVCDDSYQRVLQLGEEPWRVFQVGSPVVESVREVLTHPRRALADVMPVRRHNVLCTFHPMTTEAEAAGRQCEALVQGLELAQRTLDIGCLFTHPNNEPGSSLILDVLARAAKKPGFTVVRNLGWSGYLSAVSQCNAVVGNSSSGLLEAPIVGVPSLDVGTRQRGRFAPPTVVRVEPYEPQLIADALVELLTADRGTPPVHPYGDGTATARIERALRDLAIARSRQDILRKSITY